MRLSRNVFKTVVNASLDGISTEFMSRNRLFINDGSGGKAGLFQGSKTELFKMTACSEEKECEIKGRELAREMSEGTNGFTALEPASSAVKRPV
jgi:hypothetical protein